MLVNFFFMMPDNAERGFCVWARKKSDYTGRANFIPSLAHLNWPEIINGLALHKGGYVS